jgi:hypothetical protein
VREELGYGNWWVGERIGAAVATNAAGADGPTDAILTHLSSPSSLV